MTTKSKKAVSMQGTETAKQTNPPTMAELFAMIENQNKLIASLTAKPETVATVATVKAGKGVSVKSKASEKAEIKLTAKTEGGTVVFTGKDADKVFVAYTAKYPKRWTLITTHGFKVGQSKAESVLKFIAKMNKA